MKVKPHRTPRVIVECDIGVENVTEINYTLLLRYHSPSGWQLRKTERVSATQSIKQQISV